MVNNLWAPWRGAYVTGKKPEGCVFCGIYGNSCDRENQLLYRGEHIFIIMNRFPYNNGHIMLLPARHIADYASLSDDEIVELGKLTKISIGIMKEVFNPDGFNIGYNIGSAAGAGIAAHLHQHIVPRWNGDTNFMPVIGEIKVISEHMETTYLKLAEKFDKLREV